MYQLQRGTFIYEKFKKAVFCTFRLVLSHDATFNLQIKNHKSTCGNVGQLL